MTSPTPKEPSLAGRLLGTADLQRGIDSLSHTVNEMNTKLQSLVSKMSGLSATFDKALASGGVGAGNSGPMNSGSSWGAQAKAKGLGGLAPGEYHNIPILDGPDKGKTTSITVPERPATPIGGTGSTPPPPADKKPTAKSNGGGPLPSAGGFLAVTALNHLASAAGSQLSPQVSMDAYASWAATSMAAGNPGGLGGFRTEARASTFGGQQATNRFAFNGIASGTNDAAQAGFIRANTTSPDYNNSHFQTFSKTARSVGILDPSAGAAGSAQFTAGLYSMRGVNAALRMGMPTPIAPGGRYRSMGEIAGGIMQRVTRQQSVSGSHFNASMAEGMQLSSATESFAGAAGIDPNILKNILRSRNTAIQNGMSSTAFDKLTQDAAQQGSGGRKAQKALEKLGVSSSNAQSLKNASATSMATQSDVADGFRGGLKKATDTVAEFNTALRGVMDMLHANGLVGGAMGGAAGFGGALQSAASGYGYLKAAQFLGAKRGTGPLGKIGDKLGGKIGASTAGQAAKSFGGKAAGAFARVGGKAMLGKLGAAGAAGALTYKVTNSISKKLTKHSSSNAKIAGGVASGALTGAAIGTLVPIPGVGTVVGAGVGALIGFGKGEWDAHHQGDGNPGGAAAAGQGGGGGSPPAAAGATGGKTGADAVRVAEKYLGMPYHWGGNNPKSSFDCSGLTQWSYKQIGINLPRTSRQQSTVGKPVDKNKLQIGDLLFYKYGGSKVIDHEAMYIGGGKQIAAPTTGEKIKIQGVDWSHFAWARRVVGAAGTLGAIPASTDGSGASPAGSAGGDRAVGWNGGDYGSTDEATAVLAGLGAGGVTPNASNASGSSAATSAAGNGSAADTSSTPAGPSNPTGNAAIVKAQAAKRGWGTGAEWASLNALVTKESHYKSSGPGAQNPTSTAYGLFQFLDSTWAGVGGHKTSDPVLQTQYGLQYIAQRYHDPIKAWSFHKSHNWYEAGAYKITDDQFATVHKGEMIVPARQAETIRQAITREHPMGNMGARAVEIKFGDIRVTVQGAMAEGTARDAGKQIVTAIVNDKRLKDILVGR